ncbi:MAG TPA: transaldolase, partial [Anaerolineales bacterium]|nr:transaldolase [Anaerolineales bacterium]
MAGTKIHELNVLGQSVWLDFIQRSLIQSGDLLDYVELGLSGITSNPAIFEKAISDSTDYDQQMEELAEAGKTPQEIYEALTVEDARRAADVLRPVFDQTRGTDGFFSLEVEPHLAHDKTGTIAAAEWLFKLADCPNVMIKVPATEEGYGAIQELTEAGINVNITLMFSQGQHERVAEAFISGLEKRLAKGYSLKGLASVASFFVSRVDTVVDKRLDECKTPEAESLKGRIGIANAKMAYQQFIEIFHSHRWLQLEDQGANIQRVLFGSTGTKNPEYSDVMYVENLIGEYTINTIPRETLDAFMDHGKVALTLEQNLDEARSQLDQLAKLGIDLEEVGQELLDDGIDKF